MADYQLSATLRLNDRGFSAGIRAAEKETSKLERGIGGLKNQKLMFQVGVEGMEKIKRYHDMMRRGGMKIPPLEISARDNATPKIQRIRQEVTSLSSKAHTVAVNIKTNGMAALGKAKNSIGEMAGGAAMAAGAGVMGVAGIGYGVVNAIQSQMDFEKQMSAVKAIMSGSSSSVADLDAKMARLTARAEEMGATTKFTAKEAAEGLYFMSMAGWTVDQQFAGLPAVLNLAAAGNTDLATTSDILTDTLTAFGLKAGETFEYDGKMIETSKHYADMMAALVTNANTDISKLGYTLKYAAPVIQAMYANGTYEDKMHGAQDAMLITGLMANAGIKESQAGTALKAMLARLSGDQRNAYFAQNALGVDFVDKETGEIRRLRDIRNDFAKVFQKGVDMEKVSDFFEQISGEKIHADTRRKLESYYETAQKNGGKLTGKEMMKMTNLLSGLEAMPGWIATFLAAEDDVTKIDSALENCAGTAERMRDIQLDNLAGDITLLGSAWDAFQRSFVKGEASEGLRSFVQTLTDMVTKANNLFADGIQVKDLFTLAADGVTKLKNKFLELDGIGSILAGGALMVGLRAILKTALKVKDTLSEWSKIKTVSDLGNQIRGNKNPSGGLSSVGTMNIKAGVVNLTGAIKQNGGANLGNRNQSRVDDYYRRRETILSSQNSGRPPSTGTPPPSTLSRFGGFMKNGLKVAGGGALLSLPFAAMDIFSAQSHSAETLAEADETVAWHKQELERLKTEGANDEQIQAQIKEVKDAEAFKQRTIEMNKQVERQANFKAAGTVAGTAIGAAIGSAVPVVGTAIGGMVGGVLGDLAGSKLADVYTASEKNNSNATKNNAQSQEISTQKNLSAKNDFDSKVSEINRKGIYDGLKSLKDWWGNLFKSEKPPVQQETDYQKNFQQVTPQTYTPLQNNITPQKITPPTLPKFELPELNLGAKIQNEFDFVSNTVSTKIDGIKTSIAGMFTGIELPNIGEFFKNLELPEFNFGEKIEGIKTSLSGMFTGIELPNIGEFFKNLELPEFNFGEKIEGIKTSLSGMFTGIELPNIGEFFKNLELPEFNFGEKIEGIKTSLSGMFTGIELPNIGEFFSNFQLPEFSISNLFPPLGISQWLTEQFAEMAGIDLTSILPDFSGIGATVSEQLNVIPEMISGIVPSISETFAQIPTAASEAFSTISMSASEGLATIQSAWGALPGFFGGLFAGLGGVASGAGAAIAAGLNSGIGMIQSAWEGLSGWLSSKIASLSAMASSAAAAIGIGGIGHNAKGTSNFAGGWSEINESGGELILLPSGAKIYPHSTTKNILRHEMKNNLPLTSGFASDGGETQKLMEDILNRRINSQRDDVFENIRTSNTLNNLQRSAFFNQSPFETLQNILGSISKADIPSPQERNFDSLGNIEGLEIPEFNRISADDDLMVAAAKRQAQLEQLSSMQSPFNFDFDSLEIPSFDIPQATQSKTTTNNSPTNNFNFGGVNISSGMNFDEFVHRLQELFTGAVNNSELV